MTEQTGLFGVPEGAYDSDTRCGGCGSTKVVRVDRPNATHYAKEECANCGKFVRWIPFPRHPIVEGGNAWYRNEFVTINWVKGNWVEFKDRNGFVMMRPLDQLKGLKKDDDRS